MIAEDAARYPTDVNRATPMTRDELDNVLGTNVGGEDDVNMIENAVTNGTAGAEGGDIPPEELDGEVEIEAMGNMAATAIVPL